MNCSYCSKDIPNGDFGYHLIGGVDWFFCNSNCLILFVDDMKSDEDRKLKALKEIN